MQILTQVVQQKFEHQWGWHTFEQRFNRDERLEKLQALQQALLLNGFRHLREGGTLVYSTCSASKKQNEDVVEWLLNTQVYYICKLLVHEALSCWCVRP